MDCKTQIAALVAPWVQACLDRDWDALLALCTDDVVFAPPGEPSVSGEESLKTWLDDFPVMTAFEFSLPPMAKNENSFQEQAMTFLIVLLF